MPAAEVAVTNLLRLLAREEATTPQARAASRNALNQVVRKPIKPIAAAATGLTDAFRVSVVNRNRPHATKALFFIA